MDRFKILHTYKMLARRGHLPLLLCECGEDLITRLGPDDEPRLLCTNCNTLMEPGLRFMMNLEEKIEEYEKNRAK